jgi:hypothetical protein
VPLAALRVWEDALSRSYRVTLSLYWEGKDSSETLREYRRGAADAAMDHLCAVSDAYWARAGTTHERAS